MDMTGCVLGCLLQVGRLCGFLDADDEVEDNGPVGGVPGLAGGGGDKQRLGDGGGSAEEIGDVGGAAGVESVRMQRLGASRDKAAVEANVPAAGADVRGGGGGGQVEDVAVSEAGGSRSV